MKNERVYFVGIGGIGMSAIARHFNSIGVKVAGYDRTATPLTAELEAEGIGISYADSEDEIPAEFRSPQGTSVVYTPAIPADSAILSFFRKNGFTVEKRAAVLGRLVSENYNPICIAGTHGKTTTSTLTAHILRGSEVGCSAFLGGISVNYNTNYWHDPKSSLMVTEADEYDRSFLHLHPYLALITATDADHLDIYGTHDEVKKAFLQFAQQTQPGGAVVYNLKASLDLDAIDEDIELFSYSLSDAKSDFYASNIKLENGRYTFSVNTPMGVVKNLTIGLPGLHNIENAVGAVALATLAGATESEISSALASFRGNRRRFEVRIATDDFCLIDDYAHHPEEIRTMLTSVKKMYAGRDLTVVFQPHLYTRTRDFADGFASALSLADHVILLDIYPAREEPIEGVTSQMLLQKITTDASLVSKEELCSALTQSKRDIVIMMGAGNIDALVPVVEQYMKDFLKIS